MKNPIFLVVVHRRFYELSVNLPQSLEQFEKETGIRPPVVLVWSEPNVGYLWIFQELQKKGLITHFLTRPEGQNKSISYYCARDLRLGLDFIKQNYPNAYAVAHCADVLPNPGVYSGINECMQTNEAFLVLLFNTVVRYYIWHTNFFAVGMDERYWPPVIKEDDPDILEHKWGKELQALNLDKYGATNNHNAKTFKHVHESEGQLKFQLKPQSLKGNLFLTVKGSQSWWVRLRNWSKEWLKYFANLIRKKKL